MDPYDKTTSCTVDFATAARNAFDQGKFDTCRKILRELWCFLSDELASNALEPCESAESSSKQ